MVDAKFTSMGKKFTGITNFKNKFQGKKAIVCCSGTTLSSYVDADHPEDWIRIAVNEGIRKIADTADFWVLSDRAIVYEYADLCKPHTTVLAMHESANFIQRCEVPDIYTMNSMPLPPRSFDNGYEFFSRGTVMIGAIEMARYMGIDEFYVFGLDCYRTESNYYYDGRTPEHTSERNPMGKRRGWAYNDGILVSERLAKMIHVLDVVKESGLWKGIKVYCVNSPRSQQKAIPHMTLVELEEKGKTVAKVPSLVERGLEVYRKLKEEDSPDATGENHG